MFERISTYTPKPPLKSNIAWYKESFNILSCISKLSSSTSPLMCKVYLPRPAVRPDIFSSNHPGHHRGEGGQAAPVGWNGDGNFPKVTFYLQSGFKDCCIRRFVCVCEKDSYHQRQRAQKQQTSSWLYLQPLQGNFWRIYTFHAVMQPAKLDHIPGNVLLPNLNAGVELRGHRSSQKWPESPLLELCVIWN